MLNGCAASYDRPVAPVTSDRTTGAASSKPRWAIGEGTHRKVFDHEPSAEELRQWRYETILATAGLQHANDFMRQELQLEAMKLRAEREKLELERMRRENEVARRRLQAQ